MGLRASLWAALLLPLSACNMVISETPLFTQPDSSNLKPRHGIWVAEDPDCRFDSSLPESRWPGCAMWLVVGAKMILLEDGRKQTEPGEYLIAKGQPPIVQFRWHDKAREDGNTFYVFFAVQPEAVEPDGTFTAAYGWEAKCGVKRPSGSQISPYPGISPECRPSSQDAVRSAAVASRSTAEMAMRWRWLRPEGR